MIAITNVKDDNLARSITMQVIGLGNGKGVHIS